MRTFSTAEVRRLTNTPRADFDYWRYDLRFIHPDTEGRWSLTDALTLSTANVLRANGFSHLQLRVIFTNLRRTLETVPRSRRAAAMFLKHVEMVEALVKINGPGPNYGTWRAHVDAVLSHWQRPPAGLDREILQLLSQRHAAAGAVPDAPIADVPHA